MVRQKFTQEVGEEEEEGKKEEEEEEEEERGKRQREKERRQFGGKGKQMVIMAGNLNFVALGRITPSFRLCSSLRSDCSVVSCSSGTRKRPFCYLESRFPWWA